MQAPYPGISLNSTKYMEQELVSIPFGKSKIDGLYYNSTIQEEDNINNDTAIIHVHGFLGNFLDGSQRFLPPILAEGGYSSIAINTRMANFGLFFCATDVSPSLGFLRIPMFILSFLAQEITCGRLSISITLGLSLYYLLIHEV